MQAAVEDVWKQISTEKLSSHTDFEGYQAEFLKLFGFGFDSIDYDAETETLRPLLS